jgi:hypothetical protein
MRKRRPAPSNEDIRDAIDAARHGKGRKLAKLIKSFSEDDLAAGFNAAGRYGNPFDPYSAIHSALAFASGRKEFRDDMNRRLRDAGNKAVREWKRQQKEAQT